MTGGAIRCAKGSPFDCEPFGGFLGLTGAAGGEEGEEGSGWRDMVEESDVGESRGGGAISDSSQSGAS